MADSPAEIATYLHPYRSKWTPDLHPRKPHGHGGGEFTATLEHHIPPAGGTGQGMTLFEPEQQKRFKREFSAMVRGAKDPETFAIAQQMHDELGRALAERAQELTDPKLPPSQRYSWGDIAQATGMSRQAAFEKFGKTKRVRVRKKASDG